MLSELTKIIKPISGGGMFLGHVFNHYAMLPLNPPRKIQVSSQARNLCTDIQVHTGSRER